MKKLCAFIVLFCAMCCACRLGYAETPLQTCPPAGYTTNNAWDYSMGYRFTPNVNGQITKLGGYFSGTKWVRLYDASYTLLASAQVMSAYNWVYTSITPVSVTSGATYYVVVEVASSGGVFNTYTTPNTCGNVTMNASTYQTPSGTFNSGHAETPSYMYGLVDVEFTVGGGASAFLLGGD
ncbi:MAG: DUF4082 domain-containing protein [Candidatus Omnitrophica bacterium]|nr:DUF4082 domain-containing protein [Candidatus Omnitrophota bacterium]